MNKLLIATAIWLIAIPSIALADVNVTTNIWTDENVNIEANVNTTGNTTIEINGVPWKYEPEKWSQDRVGITRGVLGTLSKFFYTPWVLSPRDYYTLSYLVDIINKVTMPYIIELQYQNEAYRYMLEELYGDKFNEKYCWAKCKVGNKYKLEYVLCDELICREGPENVWYCNKQIDENTTVGIYKFDFSKK